MSQAPKHDPHAREAADWFARLNARTVSVTDLEAFRTWRADPARRASYERVEATWRLSENLKSDPEIMALAAEAVRRPRSQRRPWFVAGAVVATGMAAVAAFTIWTETRTELYQTLVGERRTVRLADGSMLSLDTDSAVRVKLRSSRRDLELVQGQALFDVAHDANRPFRVEAAGAEVVATGTRFGVRLFGDAAQVILIEGGVTVAEGQGNAVRRWRLAAGQQIVAGDRATAGPVPTPDAAAAASWVDGRLTFDGTPLAAAVAEFNRYGGPPILLGSGTIGSTPISGAFDSGDKAAFADAVAQLYGLRLTADADGYVLSARPTENNS